MNIQQTKWEAVGDALMYDWPHLNENSVVLVIGAYKGYFTKRVADKYKCTVYSCEPIKEFYDEVCREVRGNERVHCYNVAVGATTRTDKISVAGDCSSLLVGKRTRQVNVVSIDDCLSSLDHVDLAQLNCEGGEYEILPRLIQTGDINKILVLGVQFHFTEKENERQAIIAQLKKTHKLCFDVPYNFEVWQKK